MNHLLSQHKLKVKLACPVVIKAAHGRLNFNYSSWGPFRCYSGCCLGFIKMIIKVVSHRSWKFISAERIDWYQLVPIQSIRRIKKKKKEI